MIEKKNREARVSNLLKQGKSCIINIHAFTQQVRILDRDCARYMAYNRDFMEIAIKGIRVKSQFLQIGKIALIKDTETGLGI